MSGLRDEAGPVPEMFEVQGRPLLLRRVPEVRLAVSQADVQAVRRGGHAGVTFCWPGVGAVLISLWFFRVLFRSRVVAPRSFRAVAARAGFIRR